MSHYSDGVKDRLSMCPCSSANDIPQQKEIMRDGGEEPDPVENGFEVLSGDSGSDEEQDILGAQGYVPLAQNEDDASMPALIEDGPGVHVMTSESDENLGQTATEQEVERSSDESSPSSSTAFSSAREARMGEDEIDLIKSIMVNVKIPSSSIPEWAKKIPEEKWKAPLVSSIQQRNASEDKSSGRTSS